MRERAARAVVDAEEASCALRLAVRRQAELQGSGRSCPLHPGEDVQYLGEHGGGAAAGAPIFGSVSKALPVVDMQEPTFTVLLQDGKTREVPRSLLVVAMATYQPRLTSPMTSVSGTKTSSRKISAKLRSPSWIW